jgi:diaminohydroxyphosphoribosylaminopyrimidine deaminase / 5-amino-6-(5-phosphoribosylamino)uracil reductase
MNRPSLSTDESFMLRALHLASLGRGSVSPNPMVGCVIVCNDHIIGEGWHQVYGQSHAEVNAIQSVADKSLLSQSTVYVTLEPCAHHGKTPPCVDLLIYHHVKKVVIGALDTHPLVAGKGVEKLKQAGIEVITDVLKEKSLHINRRFFTSVEKQRPYIILKWAQTLDGFIARQTYESRWISQEFSRQLVHRWRSEEDAVLVGTKTASHDNPQLNVRSWAGRHPIRIVIDRFLRLPDTLLLFDQSQTTLCYNVLKNEEHHQLLMIRLPEKDFLQHLVHDLHHRKIQSVIVEGGSFTLHQFIEGHLWDEARVFVSDKTFGEGIAAPRLPGVVHQRQWIQGDQLFTWFPVS